MPVTTIYFDVDQTLVDRDMSPLPGVIEVLEELTDHGYELIAWSRSGGSAARFKLGVAGLKDYFRHVLTKPDVCVDDSPAKIIGQVVSIDNKNDWKNFFTKFYGKKTY